MAITLSSPRNSGLLKGYMVLPVCSERLLDCFHTTDFTNSFKKLNNHCASLYKWYYSSFWLISSCGHLEGRDYSSNPSLQLTMTCHASLVVSAVKSPSAMIQNLSLHPGDKDLIPGLGRSPGEGNGNPLQYSCLENPIDRGAWWATALRVTNSQTHLKLLSMHSCTGQR